jgi:succinate-semialdehyde dehydrogenase/glutarate-semialdehyde dehydrogenase
MAIPVNRNGVLLSDGFSSRSQIRTTSACTSICSCYAYQDNERHRDTRGLSDYRGTSKMELKLQREELLRRQNFIGGKWSDAAETARYPVTNPATGNVIAEVANSGRVDARAATDAANHAAREWRERLPRERAEILRRWHALIVQNAEDLATLMSMEQGKPMAESRGEVAYGASYVAWFADEATRIYGDLIPQQQRGKQMRAFKEPVGIVAAITPWNFPLAMIARKIAPALAAGCTVVSKPAEDTPLTALALAKLAEEAGVPPGVLNMLSASREQGIEAVGDWLADDRVRKITFTGSTAVGKYLARESAGTLKKLSLELGGNAPFIVFEDADLDAAVAGLMVAKFRNGGQTCVCPNRIYVQANVFDKFAELLAARVSALKVAPATDPQAQIGPMINAKAVAKISRHVDDAVSKGAKVLAGGTRLEALGENYYAPTVLTDATNDMLVTCEETFGPVAPLYRFGTEEDVIRLANDTPFGLAAYFYTRDMRRAERVSRRLEAGVVGLNEGAVASEAAPFGGVKESGYGREGSKYGLDDYLSIKYVCQGNLDG